MKLTTQNSPLKTLKSFHHRMARLVRDAFRVKCQMAGCPSVAVFVCEYDYMRGQRARVATWLYCAEHAGNFAERHNIYMTDLPDVLHTQLETASRDDWRYSEDESRTNTNPRQTASGTQSEEES